MGAQSQGQNRLIRSIMKNSAGRAEFSGSAVILTAYKCENNADKMSALPAKYFLSRRWLTPPTGKV